MAAAAAVLLVVSAVAFALPASGHGRGGGQEPAAVGDEVQPAVAYELRPTRVGPPLGACAATADSDSSSAFALGGGQMNSSTQLPITVSTAGLPAGVTAAGFEAALDNSISPWEGTQLGNAFGTPSPTAASVSARRDGTSTVTFSNKRVGNAVGLTILQSFDSSGNLTEADTILNSRYPWSLNGSFSGDPDAAGKVAGCAGEAGKFDVQAVLTHELGHWVRLEHVANDVQTMFPAIGTGELRKRTLGAGDTNGANTKY